MKRFLLVELNFEESSTEETIYDQFLDLDIVGSELSIICDWKENDVLQHGDSELAVLGGYKCKCGNYWGTNGCDTQNRGF